MLSTCVGGPRRRKFASRLCTQAIFHRPDFRMTHSHLRTTLSAAIAITFAGALPAQAGSALYHLTPLTVPDATSVSVTDINDAGQIVGFYTDADFNRHAVLWDSTGWHDLAVPSGDGIARAINDAGQIVGTSDDFVVATQGLLWDAATPDTWTVLNEDPDVAVSPADINDDGVVAGGFGVPSRAFVWTAADGLVDYGIQDPDVEDQQARWTAINDAGKLVGFWNQHVSNIHATAGMVGTPAVIGLGGDSAVQRTSIAGMNGDGVAVGLGSFDESVLVPVVFADDGSFAAIDGATLDQNNGSAIAINDAGVIVGTAGIGTANGPVPGLKAWVHRDGATYDLFEVVDDTSGFSRFANAVAINDAGVIVGTGRDADDNVVSFVLTPIAADGIFADGFDP
jgi:probable HAF family extracellular repeat protein